ncbi:MAG TPA: hypothetical protein VNF45_05325 [Candidatus Binataceae bacterium]|nr:hypothetical protein [Candidatus Binataceae bacterium]
MLRGTHRATIRDARGRVAARVAARNMVTTAGVNYALGAGFAGQAPITSWYVGMIVENRHVGDGAMTAGAATLTSATAAFAAGDAGRQVTVFGAGAAGASLVTTIVAVVNATTATMAANAGTTVSGAIVSIGPAFATADTTSAHPGWAEVGGAQVANATRPAWTPGAVSGGSVDDSAAQAVYTMAAGLAGIVYLHGLFLVSTNVLGAATGTLYSEAEFIAGAQAVQAGYQVSDTYTIQLIAG